MKRLFTILLILSHCAACFAQEVKVSLILPINSSGTANENYLDFYSGALLAARDLGREGISVRLEIFDSADKTCMPDSTALSGSDFIIGPVSVEAIEDVLELCSDSTFVISPLEPKVISLTDSSRVIQSPTDWKILTMELAKWAKDSLLTNDSVILLCDGSSMGDEYGLFISECLDSLGLAHHTVMISPDGAASAEMIEAVASKDGKNHIFVTSDKENFIGDVIRATNLMSFHQFRTLLYCPAKARSYPSIDVESIHNCNMRITSGYYTDYTGKDVRKFVKAYRALYHMEPNSFAFQGYDLLSYFVKARAYFGDEWLSYLTIYRMKGLQTDFRFSRNEGSRGFFNTAARHISFNPDYSTDIK